jgi:hypothetical protein
VIRPLRRAHRVVMLALAVVLPVLVALAVAARRPAPVQHPWTLDLPR